MPDLSLLTGLQPTWRDPVEIVLVAVLFYRALGLIRGTRARQMLGGVGVLAVVYGVAFVLEFRMITHLLGVGFTYGAFGALVVFQPELRAALAHLGPSRLGRATRQLESGEVLDEIVEAVDRLSRSGIGAILVLERDTPLDEYLESGTALSAKVSADLLATIFTPYSPLHDGAVVIRGDTIVGASCILPLSASVRLDRSLGTRHRAALGLTEESDAVVIVISEERAAISVAAGGALRQELTPLQLRDVLAGREPRATAEHSVPPSPATR
ncbi:MAG TPA: diadenylate cyclase CdaA [Gemmatimonadaceae bacterium]|nr:diadenylate cyclase CdaA [Gemmatimonadaceae bacterium]